MSNNHKQKEQMINPYISYLEDIQSFMLLNPYEADQEKKINTCFQVI